MFCSAQPASLPSSVVSVDPLLLRIEVRKRDDSGRDPLLVAIELAGPVVVDALGARTLRSAGSLVLAVAGVLVLAGVEAEGTARGVTFALLAGAFWAGYILLGHRVARSPASVDGLGLGRLAGAVAIGGFGVSAVGGALDAPLVLALAVTGSRACSRAKRGGSTRRITA